MNFVADMHACGWCARVALGGSNSYVAALLDVAGIGAGPGGPLGTHITALWFHGVVIKLCLENVHDTADAVVPCGHSKVSAFTAGFGNEYSAWLQLVT